MGFAAVVLGGYVAKRYLSILTPQGKLALVILFLLIGIAYSLNGSRATTLLNYAIACVYASTNLDAYDYKFIMDAKVSNSVCSIVSGTLSLIGTSLMLAILH